MIEKGTAVNSIVGFPPNMVFFSTPQNLELGSMPFTSPHMRPTREEVIEYYLGVVRKGGVCLMLRTTVESVRRAAVDNASPNSADAPRAARGEHLFVVETDRGPVRARFVVLATGYFDNVNPLDVAGDGLAKVMHYYHEPYPYLEQDVLVIGGRNSAVETALDLWRHGARVTMIHRGESFRSVKYWLAPDIDNRIREGSIPIHWNTILERLDESTAILRNLATGATSTIPNDAVFAMIGYRPDETLFQNCGIAYDSETLVPRYDPETFESSVENLFIAGSIACGCRTWEIFIENGKEHAAHVIATIAERARRRDGFLP